MLKKAYRLPLSQPSPALYYYKTPYFTAKVFRSDLPTPRFGFIVSKRVSPLAVERNRVKRQLRALIEELLPKFTSGYDILFIVQKPAVEADRQKITDALIRFLTGKKLIA